MQPAIRITLSDVSPVPGYNIEPFESGVLRTVAGLTATDWSNEYLIEISDIGERVDISQGGNYVQLGDCSVTLSNHGQWLSTLENDGATMIGAKIECGFRESIASIPSKAEWTGIISDVMMEGATVVIRAENILAERHKAIPARTITKEEFPTITSDADGSPVPILYGAVEELVPPSVLSEKTYLTALNYTGTLEAPTDIRKTASSILSASSSTFSPIVFIGAFIGLPFSPDSWLINFANGEKVYAEITDGTGSGQVRLVESITGSVFVSWGVYSTASIYSPWDTIPDSTSMVRFYSQNTGAVLVVGDEATAAAVTVEESVTSNLAFVPGTIGATGDIVTADVSAEFLFGEDYKNLHYSIPTNVFGKPELSDGISASGSGVQHKILISENYYPGEWVGDTFCRLRLDISAIPDSVLSLGADAYVILSFNLPDGYTANNVRVHFQGVRLGGTVDHISASGVYPTGGDFYSAYSPSILPDGVAGNFSSFAIQIPSAPVPLTSYSHMLVGATVDGNLLNTNVNYPKEEVETYSMGSSYVYVIPDVFKVLSVGDLVRPASQILFGTSQYSVNRLLSGVSTYGASSDWREVVGITTGVSGHGAYTTRVEISSPFDDYGYSFGLYFAADVPDNFVTVRENEVGVAFAFGSISATSRFLVATSSGRTYSALWPALPSGKSIGDSITLARDMALDILYRDLGLTSSQVNYDSFQNLLNDPVTAAIVDKQDSASVLADLCAEFSWVISHDEYGRETAHGLLSSVGGSGDVTVDTGDIVEGSFTGRDITDVQDLCTQPSFAWDWTQNKGYRQSSNVLDISVDPATLTADNYQRYIVGFGDYATSLDIYQRLYASYQLSRYRRSQEYEYKYIGSSISSMLSPIAGISRFEWIASRKFVFRFEVAEGSSSAPKRPGLRIALRHKRYTQGVWVYGTCIESTLSTSDAVYKITMMVDPGDLTPGGAELYVDSLGYGTEYIDVLDGVTDQYIDTLGLT